jgi:large subunit ribosomal protein L18
VEHKLKKKKRRTQRKKRIRKKVFGTNECPRMSVYRSLNHCYVQLIDDASNKTIMGMSTLSRKFTGQFDKTGNVEAAKKLGSLVAERALEKNIKIVVFDRNGFLYHGRIKAVAEGAREKGLQF